MCIDDERRPKSGPSASSTMSTRSLGIVGGLIHPTGRYSRRSELTLGTTRNGLDGNFSIASLCGDSARASVGADPLARRNLRTSLTRARTLGRARISSGSTPPRASIQRLSPRRNSRAPTKGRSSLRAPGSSARKAARSSSVKM